ncbi:MAG TPA: hypothetical protein VGK03_12850 [Geothrix sp.]
MKRIMVGFLFASLVACSPPWLYPKGRINTLAAHQQEAYEFIKAFHDKRNPSDRMNMVYQAIILEKQENDLGSFESWVIRTENGNRFEYILQIAIYWEGRNAHGIHGHQGMAIVRVKELPKPPV